MVRAGYKKWYEAGFPRGADGRPPEEYFQRARDEWVRMSHDEAAVIVAAALKEHRRNLLRRRGQTTLDRTAL